MSRILPGALIAILVGCPAVARADGVWATPDNWPRAWNFDALLLFNIGVLTWVYVRGVRRLWDRTGAGKCIARGQVAAFVAAMALVLLALLSPLDALSEQLAWAHMTQHMLLMNVAALLLVFASPTLAIAWGLPRDWRRLVRATPLGSDLLWRPAIVWVLLAATLWVWHYPLLYQAALRDPLVHDAQHLSFFIAAWFFWRLVFDPRSRRRLHPLAAVFFLFTTSLQASLLGIYMALAPEPWYADYLATTSAWGITPLEDQQAAGLIMWAPACVVYPAAGAIVFGLWIARLAPATEEMHPITTPIRVGRS